MAGTPDGIDLFFSKPMNPVQASNVHNYTVRETRTTFSGTEDLLDSTPLLGFLGGGVSTSKSAKSVPLRSANYDPANFTVTLIPERRPTYSATGSIVVTPGTPAKTSARSGTGQAPPKVSLTWMATRSTKAGNRENSGFQCFLGILHSPDEGRSALSCGSFGPDSRL